MPKAKTDVYQTEDTEKTGMLRTASFGYIFLSLCRNLNVHGLAYATDGSVIGHTSVGLQSKVGWYHGKFFSSRNSGRFLFILQYFTKKEGKP